MLTKPDVADLLAKIESVFPRFTYADETVAAWHSLFKYETPEVANAALDEVLKTSEFAPKPADVAAAISRIKKPAVSRIDPEVLREYRANQLANGLVQAFFRNRSGDTVRLATRFVPASSVVEMTETVKTAGKEEKPIYRSKIDFAIDRLGADVVADELRSLVPDLTWSGLCRTPGWTSIYRAKLDELVERARNITRRNG